MKKFINLSLAILCAISFGLVMSACKKPKAVEIAVKDGTLNTEVYVGESVNTSNVVLLVTYDNDEVKEVAKNDEMTFSNVDTSVAGQKTLTISYLNLTTEVTITVTAQQTQPQYIVQSFEAPQFASDFAANAQLFKIKTSTYKVGDDNAFVFKPKIMGYQNVDGSIGEIDELDYVESTFKVEQKDGSNYTEISGQSLENIVEIDEQKYAFDFTTEAVGNTYRITISANTINGEKSVGFEFEIVDGYNIQSKSELSVIDNNPNTQSVWAELKTQNNVPTNINPNAVAIHGSFVLENSDVPSDYFYNTDDADYLQGTAGTLRNWRSIYSHDVPSGSTYSIYGNYNTIDASAIAITEIDIIKANTTDSQGSGHSALFSFGADNELHPTTVQGNVVIDGLTLIGNSNRSENEKLKGGLLMVLTGANDTLLRNLRANSWLTNMVALNNVDSWENSTHILECDIKDSFSNMFYYYGIKNNYIENSDLVGSGGPIFALTHVDPRQNVDSRYSNMEVKNSHLETFVNGTEAWFLINDANSTATELFAVDEVFSLTSQGAVASGLLENAKTFKKNDKANFVGMITSNGNPITNTDAIKGKIVFKNANDEVTYTYDMNDQNFKQLASQILPNLPAQAIAKIPFFSAGGEIATVTVGADYSVTGLGKDITTPFIDPSDLSNLQQIKRFFESKYLGLFVNGIPTIGAVVEFYDM